MHITRDTFVDLLTALHPNVELYLAYRGLAIFTNPALVEEIEELARNNGLLLRKTITTRSTAVVRVYGFAKTLASVDQYGAMVRGLARDAKKPKVK